MIIISLNEKKSIVFICVFGFLSLIDDLVQIQGFDPTVNHKDIAMMMLQLGYI